MKQKPWVSLNLPYPSLYHGEGMSLHVRPRVEIREQKPHLISQQSGAYLFKRVFAMQAISATDAETYINVLMSIRAQPLGNQLKKERNIELRNLEDHLIIFKSDSIGAKSFAFLAFLRRHKIA